MSQCNQICINTTNSKIPIICNTSFSCINIHWKFIFLCYFFYVIIWSSCRNYYTTFFTLLQNRLYTLFKIWTFFICTHYKRVCRIIRFTHLHFLHLVFFRIYQAFSLHPVNAMQLQLIKLKLFLLIVM